MKGSDFMGDIIYLSEYRKAKGIAAPRSPYSTLNATKAEISNAINYAAQFMSKPMDHSGVKPYAALIGYEDQNGRVKLLKDICFYPNRDTFEMHAGRKGMKALGLIANDQ